MIKRPDLRSLLALVSVGAVVVQQMYPGTRWYVIAAAVAAAVATHAAAPSSSTAPAIPPGRVAPSSSSAPAVDGRAPMAERRYPVPPSKTVRSGP